MIEDPATIFRALAPLVAVTVPVYAARVRSRQYAGFAGVVLLLSLPGAVIVHERLLDLLPEAARAPLSLLFAYLVASVGIHLGSLVSPRLRPSAFRHLVSIPGQVFLAAGFLAGVWLLLLAPLRVALLFLGADTTLWALAWADLVPFVVACVSLVTTQRPVWEHVRIVLGDDGPARVARVPLERYRWRRPPPAELRPLRIVQIADPHLGPWQSVRKLRRHVEQLLRRDPDLILLTGDFLTMEAAGTPGALATALEPLAPLSGRTFSVFGNHDYDAPDEVRRALAANGIELLVDAESCVATEAGPVQIVGADCVRREREAHLRQLLATFPRREGHLRILLLHDPLGFQFVPVGEADLTLSGHTHGGQIGLVSLGLDWTVLSRSSWPDHGLFAHGSNRLYVHRGSGFYGFPLRIGVPGEASLLEVLPGPGNPGGPPGT